jgi:cyclophilin family peptidyl-prolyl cis-trans isomerase
MYPQTVQHFIELASNNFFDNTIIHDYETNYWYGGGYSYVADGENGYTESYEDGNLLDEYIKDNSLESKYYNDMFKGGKLTPSVYLEHIGGNYQTALATLIGEFSSNNHTIEKNALTSGYGNLSMYYTSKTTTKHVYLDKTGTDGTLLGDYKYNSATSIFRIQVGSGTSTDSTHAVFGVLKDTTVLDDLVEAIEDYIDDLDGDFTKNCTANVDLYDEVEEGGVTDTYTMTKLPIVIQTVKVTKY